jgi:hypothetical protein
MRADLMNSCDVPNSHARRERLFDFWLDYANAAVKSFSICARNETLIALRAVISLSALSVESALSCWPATPFAVHSESSPFAHGACMNLFSR